MIKEEACILWIKRNALYFYCGINHLILVVYCLVCLAMNLQAWVLIWAWIIGTQLSQLFILPLGWSVTGETWGNLWKVNWTLQCYSGPLSCSEGYHPPQTQSVMRQRWTLKLCTAIVYAFKFFLFYYPLPITINEYYTPQGLM